MKLAMLLVIYAFAFILGVMNYKAKRHNVSCLYFYISGSVLTFILVKIYESLISKYI